jgi:hypothetical protein
MNIRDVTSAIGVYCHRHNESRTQQIAYLYPNVIVTVSKRRQFNDAWILCLSSAEHLRKD